MFDVTTIQGIRVPLSAMRFHPTHTPRQYPHRARYDSRQIISAALLGANVIVWGYVIARAVLG